MYVSAKAAELRKHTENDPNCAELGWAMHITGSGPVKRPSVPLVPRASRLPFMQVMKITTGFQ